MPLTAAKIKAIRALRRKQPNKTKEEILKELAAERHSLQSKSAQRHKDQAGLLQDLYRRRAGYRPGGK